MADKAIDEIVSLYGDKRKDSCQIYAHTSFVGHTGYNNHSRNFFTYLNKLISVKVRNFTAGVSWRGITDDTHGGEKYLSEEQKNMMVCQTTMGSNGRYDHDIYDGRSVLKNDHINIVLNETNHHYFYDNYDGIKIAYNVWESTRQPEDYFKKLLEFDYLWVPTEWQRQCSIDQGYPTHRVFVVPEAVNGDIFFPEEEKSLDEYKDERFKFVLFGRWDYRKSVTEIISTFLKTFSKDEPVDLVVSIDNPYSGDGLNSTEERLKHHGFEDDRIKMKHFPSREDYIKYMKAGNVFVSCARSEGWNLPLIEAMACGTPSIYSDWGAQLEFAKGKGLPVSVLGERPASDSEKQGYKMFSGNTPGNYCEPDFDDLAVVMRHSYDHYDECKAKALEDSEKIREEFSWKNAADRAMNIIEDISVDCEEQKEIILAPKSRNIRVNFVDGPFFEIIEEGKKEYDVEFIDKKTNNIVHSATINSNNWTKADRKWFTDWKINAYNDGELIFSQDLDLGGKNVLISMDTSSLGDTLAWIPYAEEFAEKHKCTVFCATFWNRLIEKEYPKINFVSPGSTIDNIFAAYSAGWYFPFEGIANPIDFRDVSMQQTMSDILGLEYREIKPKVTIPNRLRDIEGKYICIGIHSTAQCKYWNYPSGWQEITDYLKELGYKVVVIHKEQGLYMGNASPSGVIDKSGDIPIEDRMVDLKYADMFIGIGSGLSWLSWAIGTPTVLISGFSKPYCEFTTDVKRIHNDTVCNGCFNDSNETFDRGKWDWCPREKDFECTKEISPEMVKVGINLILREKYGEF